jgi:tricorn protease
VPEGFRIDAILPDDTARGGPESPLAAPHRHVHVGDVIVAIDGRSAAGVNELGELLRGRAGKQVAVVLENAEGTQRVLEVIAVSDEPALRYSGWVEQNRKYVADKSGGRLGYMHLTDMDSAGLIQFVRDFYPQYRRDGLVIDERWNHGGYVSQMMLERLRRKPIAADVPREGTPATYPSRAASGPMAVLVNERAGSDGDIFPTGFRLYGLGPIIGTRTWGGVVGIRSDKPFIDGGEATQPEFAWWDPAGGFKMENHGVDPDIVVELSPADIAAGRDPQLDRAIAEVMSKLDKTPTLKPPVPSKQNTTIPPAAK